jgi:hypothetical protein
MRNVMIGWLAAFCPLAAAQDGNGVTPGEIDACGLLVSKGGCVLFEGGGGSLFLSDYGDFRAGDVVRVIGTVNPNCTTICEEADGCIADAQVYNPLVFPCGTDIPSFPGDIIGDLCTSLSGALTATMLIGLWFARPRR